MKYLAIVLLLISLVSVQAQPIPPAPQPWGGLALPKIQAGRFIGSPLVAASSGQAVSAANRLYATPFFTGSTQTVTSMSFRISTGNAAAWNARMCIYADGGGIPGSLVGDSGTIAIGSGSVTGTQTASPLTIGLSGPGWYWIAWMADSNSESVNSINTTSGAIVSSIEGYSTAVNALSNTWSTGVFATQSFGSCPSTFPAPSFGDGTNTPYVVLGF